MSGILQNKVALVTGGSRGIGYAIAAAYLQAEARVVICGRDANRLREAEESLRKLGGVMAIPCDVAIFEQVEEMVRKIVAQFGRIDILVNNAGISMTYGRVGEIDPIRWARVIKVNLIGTFNCCHAVLPHMLKQGNGKIINLKGYGARMPSPRVTAYGASKAGVAAFTRSLSREYKGTGITVNILSPGVVRTELLLNRETTEEGKNYRDKFDWVIDLLAGAVEKPAALAVKMVSDQTDGITGKEFRVMTKTKLAFRMLRFGIKRLFVLM
jgi:NAD(P)-dependent dehydrogenase (short-subunit alcohol dehydrogenase family)